MSQSKKIPLYQVDAFTSVPFSGNPAAVCVLPEFLENSMLQNIAAENNLSETAFVVTTGDTIRLRWFTPGEEVDLCGHATLASAYVYFLENPGRDEVRFQTRSGELIVSKDGDALLMDFPVIEFEEYDFTEAVAGMVESYFAPKQDVMLIMEDAESIRQFEIGSVDWKALPGRGLILTSCSTEGLYSRCFFPKTRVPEDPFTGSAHCQIVPYWTNKLGQERFLAKQGLERVGTAECWVNGDRMMIRGEAALYLKGEITV